MNPILFEVSAPWVLRSFGPFTVVSSTLPVALNTKGNFNLIHLDGRKMQMSSDFYDELSRGLKLPDYFGRNLNALDECLCDLEWLPGDGFILLIQEAEKVLGLEPPEKLEGFIDALKRAGEEWSHPVAAGEPWDRPAKPFHVVFQCHDSNWQPSLPTIENG